MERVGPPILSLMSRPTDNSSKPPMASQDLLSEEAGRQTPLRRAPLHLRDARAAIFAALVCIGGGLAFLVGQFGWWALLIGPAYLAGVALVAMLARGRAQALLAVALASASTGIVVALIKLTGLA